MRTYSSNQIFVSALTNSGQLDARYVRITGNASEANLNSGVKIGSMKFTPEGQIIDAQDPSGPGTLTLNFTSGIFANNKRIDLSEILTGEGNMANLLTGLFV